MNTKVKVRSTGHWSCCRLWQYPHLGRCTCSVSENHSPGCPVLNGLAQLCTCPRESL